MWWLLKFTEHLPCASIQYSTSLSLSCLMFKTTLSQINAFITVCYSRGDSQVALVVKNLPVNAGELREVALMPGSGRSPGGGNGNPLQDSCLENPMDRGAWWATVHGITKSWIWLKQLSRHIEETAWEVKYLPRVA